MEHTLVLIKPDGVEKGVVGDVLHRFEKAGLRVAGLKMVQLNDVILETWYFHHKDKPFFPGLKTFMKRTPVVIVALEGHNAVAQVREMCGPTDSKKAPRGTIRGDHGGELPENIIHTSDSAERAKEEIALLFAQGEVFDYKLGK